MVRTDQRLVEESPATGVSLDRAIEQVSERSDLALEAYAQSPFPVTYCYRRLGRDNHTNRELSAPAATPRCQDAFAAAGVARYWGGGFTEEPAVGVEPVTLLLVVVPTCPSGPLLSCLRFVDETSIDRVADRSTICRDRRLRGA